MANGVTVRDIVGSDGYVHFFPAYQQSSDPGAVGAGATWTDTSGGTGNWVTKKRNAANDGWETIASTPKDNFTVKSADGAVTPAAYDQIIFITKGTAAALTLADPTATTHDGAKILFVSTTAAAHTVSNAAGSGFFSTGGASKDVATFGGAIGDGFAIVAYQGKWYIDPRGVTNVTLG